MTGTPLPTPPPSVRPSIETVPKMETETPERQQRKTTKGTFEHLQNLDREAIKKYLKTLIKVRGKWSQMTERDREDFVKAEMMKKLDARERPSGSKASTARFTYPLKWSEEREVAWVLRYFRDTIAQGGAGAVGDGDGQDDEEELPQSSMPKIKQETPDEASEDLRKYRPAKRDILSYGTKEEEEMHGGEEDEGDVPKKTAMARCRALSIVPSPATATRPYWSWNEGMELVVFRPSNKAKNDTRIADADSKRKRDQAEALVASKKVKVQET
ncbi:hypothetical protein LTR37_008302 [Vermiconidia calcicola]|uniref:Uncharacterized protein n=1 Tax=Vermiconidia calcicola TaxID=1690605 RepID=A0ACC3NE51_9PEZI|nr:hypothetical protein LTR37_008302 [Vermiconidia calcicola]